MTTSTPDTAKQPPAPQVWPTLRAHDARALIRFLVEAFGFEETVVYGDDDVVQHAQLSWPEGGGIMLGSGREDSSLKNLPTGIGSIYLVTQRPDELYERAKEAGASIEMELHDTDYGSRGFTCRDPEGVYWSFGTYAGEG
jgi:uncharacterized glyoxalase superfamily protein PhnB